METMRIAVIGAGGRMGRNLIRAISESDGAELSGALEREGAEEIGRLALPLAEKALEHARKMGA